MIDSKIILKQSQENSLLGLLLVRRKPVNRGMTWADMRFGGVLDLFSLSVERK